ncbi:MAG: hypothetical protein C0P64_007285, partial [Bacillota bacterium]
ESIKNGKAVPPLRRGTFFSVWGSFLRATRWSLGYSTATTYRYSLDGVRDKFEIDASTMAIKQSFVTCGGYISIRPYTMFGTTKIDLVKDSAYLVAPEYAIIGKHSNTWYKTRPFKVTVESQGYYRANPSKCIQFTDTVTDKWELDRTGLSGL